MSYVPLRRSWCDIITLNATAEEKNYINDNFYDEIFDQISKYHMKTVTFRYKDKAKKDVQIDNWDENLHDIYIIIISLTRNLFNAGNTY